MTFEDYARERLPFLIGLANPMSRDANEAQDVAQEVLLKIFARWDSISALPHRDAYVRRMMLNELTSWRRKWLRSVPMPEIEGPDEREDHAERISDRDFLLAEIRRLPRQQRAVVVLRYFGDLSDSQIAADLGCSPGTVRVHASRALRTLRVQPLAVTTSLGGAPA